jgi:hypothetical protein
MVAFLQFTHSSYIQVHYKYLEFRWSAGWMNVGTGKAPVSDQCDSAKLRICKTYETLVGTGPPVPARKGL